MGGSNAPAGNPERSVRHNGDACRSKLPRRSRVRPPGPMRRAISGSSAERDSTPAAAEANSRIFGSTARSLTNGRGWGVATRRHQQQTVAGWLGRSVFPRPRTSRGQQRLRVAGPTASGNLWLLGGYGEDASKQLAISTTCGSISPQPLRRQLQTPTFCPAGRNLHFSADGDHQRCNRWRNHLLHHQRNHAHHLIQPSTPAQSR